MVFDILDGFDVLINAAAYTNVDGAEDQKELAHAVNSNAPGAMARACLRHDIPMIHISTDYVFDGQNEVPYEPHDATAPLGVYGKTKLSGEKEVMAAGGRALVLRTSWVYDGLGKNFLTTMLRLSETRDALSVVDDQIGRPTFTGHLALATLKAAEVFVHNSAMAFDVYLSLIHI